MVTRFLLVCEGSSDAPLAFHIQRLFESCGYPRPDFNVSSEGRFLVDKIRSGFAMAPQYDVLFIHRDADSAVADPRYREITEAVQRAGYDGPWVGIVPVRMTESWLLLDEAAIRNAAGNPNGRIRLDLPSPAEAERMADPKSALRSAIIAGAEVQGRRRRTLTKRLPGMRDQLLENLPVGGPLEQLESWTRFRDDTLAALNQIPG